MLGWTKKQMAGLDCSRRVAAFPSPPLSVHGCVDASEADAGRIPSARQNGFFHQNSPLVSAVFIDRTPVFALVYTLS